MRRRIRIETFPKSRRRVTKRNTAEPVPDLDDASGVRPSGTPDQARPSRANSEPLVTIQTGERRAPEAAGL